MSGCGSFEVSVTAISWVSVGLVPCDGVVRLHLGGLDIHEALLWKKNKTKKLANTTGQVGPTT